MNRLWELQHAAERAVRHAALNHPPADAGDVQVARDAVHDAYQLGRAQVLLEVTNAFALALQDEEGFDIDTFNALLEDLNRGLHDFPETLRKMLQDLSDDSKMTP